MLVFLALGFAAARGTETAFPAGDDGHPVRLSEVEVVEARVSALTQAPTESRLDAVQPQSIISLETITNTMSPTADYATIANLAPSVANVETNGPGLSESKHLTLRGFDDNSYNVTFDGIPFGDINDFSHHSTSYFPAKLIGQIVIDRGPGTASTIGEATFGGTIAMYSKDPRTDFAFIPTLSYGSWNTVLGHFELNSGLWPAADGASAIASYQYMSTDGYRTHSDMKRHTTYLKYLQPLGKNTELTFLSSYNWIKFNNPGKVTQQAIDTYGRDYGLRSDPTATDYFGYNFQAKQADFEYLGITSRVAEGVRIEDKLYTYYYNNESHESPSIGSVFSKSSMTGAFKVNRYRTFGNYFLITSETAVGILKTGLWFDYSRNPRYQYRLDYTRAEAIDYDPLTGKAPKNTFQGWAYNMVDYLRTYQPFVEYDWHLTPALVINPGLKYVRFTRVIEASLNQTKPPVPLSASQTDEKTVPYLAANYRIDGQWSAYAQAAKGFLAPNLNQFYVTDPSHNQIKPEETTNYQVGTVFKRDRFNADLDAYWINFKNYPVQIPDPAAPSNPIFALAKGAYFSGLESQATYSLGNGLSLYGNASLNDATFKKSKLEVPYVPKHTAVLGLVYEGKEGFFGSLTDKYVGRGKIYSGNLNPDLASSIVDTAETDSYWIADLSVGYSLKLRGRVIRSAKIRAQVGNLFNQKIQVLDSISRTVATIYTPYTDNSYNVLPGRNYFLTVSGEF